jgi:hypothetical protein
MAAVIAAEISNANAATFTYSQKDNARPRQWKPDAPKFLYYNSMTDR